MVESLPRLLVSHFNEQCKNHTPLYWFESIYHQKHGRKRNRAEEKCKFCKAGQEFEKKDSNDSFFPRCKVRNTGQKEIEEADMNWIRQLMKD